MHVPICKMIYTYLLAILPQEHSCLGKKIKDKNQVTLRMRTKEALSPARWHDKHTYLSSLGMLGTTQLNSFFFCKSHDIQQWIYETRLYKAENDK